MVVCEGSGVADVAYGWERSGAGVRVDGDSRLTEVFDSHQDFVGLAGGIVADVVEDEFLFEAFEVVVTTVSEEFCSVFRIADV